MNKTEQVSIGRKAFVCDTDAYKMLNDYIARSRQALGDDPDVDEIMADLEASMASHIEQQNGGLVINKQAAEAVIDVMGEVESSNDSGSDKTETASEAKSKIRSFFGRPPVKDRERKIVDGVCAGIAKSLDTDPFWIRLLFVALTFATSGFWLLVYLVLSLTMKSEDEQVKRTAGEVVGDVKNKLAEGAKPYERFLRRFIKGLAKLVFSGLSLFVLILLLGVGIAWSGLLFFMLTNPSKVVLFGPNPSMADFVAIIAIGLAIILPIFVLLASLLGSSIAKRKQVGLIFSSLWILVIMAGAGALMNVVPNVRARLVHDKPQTANVYVEVVNDKLAYKCLTLWGDCRELQPVVAKKQICGANVQTITSGDWKQYDRLQEHSWQVQVKNFTYPASQEQYCGFISQSLATYGESKVIFVDTVINDQKTQLYDQGETSTQNWQLLYFIRDL